MELAEREQLEAESKARGPLKLEISKINKSGELKITFSEPCVNPFKEDGPGRRLVALDEIDVARDVIDF